MSKICGLPLLLGASACPHPACRRGARRRSAGWLRLSCLNLSCRVTPNVLSDNESGYKSVRTDSSRLRKRNC